MLLFIRKSVWVCIAHFIFSVCITPLAGKAATIRRVASNALTGHVYNKANQPLAGVVITLQGGTTSQGMATVTATNGEGAFYLTCAEATPVLVFKYAGYQTQTLRINAKGPVGITLYEVGTPILPQAAGIEMVVEAPEIPDVPATYPGGITAYQAYMKQNLRYPEAAKAKEISGTVLVSFTVDEQGRILNPEVARGVAGLNEEALRLVNTMPWWTPGRRNGKPIRSSTYLRIRFEYRTE